LKPTAALPSRTQLIQRARSLRKTSTDAEALLWRLLRSRQLADLKFRRQQPFGRYIADFYSLAASLVIEVDGGQHLSDEGQKCDLERTRFLESYGLTVLRFTNLEVLRETEAVVAVIWDAVIGSSPHPNPLPEGEGTEPNPREADDQKARVDALQNSGGL